MTDFPNAGDISDSTRLVSEQKDNLENMLAATKEMPGGSASSELVISSGTVVPTLASHSIDTQGGASSDDLEHISVASVKDGHVLFIYPENDSRTIVVKHLEGGSGEIDLSNDADFSMTGVEQVLILLREGARWKEIGRIGGLSNEGHGIEQFTSSGTFVVPADITKVWITVVGGGGGGGGGGRAGASPLDAASSGSPGLLSQWDGAESSPGGLAGTGGSNVLHTGVTTPTITVSGISVVNGHHGEPGIGSDQGSGGKSAQCLGQYGQGGAGGNGAGGVQAGSGGGSGSAPATIVYKQEITGLTPGANITVTVGVGGAGGAGKGSAVNGTAGNDGIVIVEW